MTTPESDDSPRQRRDDPERNGPNRQPANVFLDNAGDTVTAVINAYRVLADHLRLGEQTAREQGGASKSNAGQGVPPWANMPGMSGMAGMTGIPIQMFRAWAQMVATWADMTMIPNAGETVRQMTKMAEAMWSMTGVAPQAEGAAASEASGPSKVHVVVELASAQPVAVEVEFDPPEGGVPRLQSLHPLRGDAPPLSGHELEFDAASGRLALALAVPPSQATGKYSGIIFDDRDDRPCGTVRVRVGDA